MKRVKVIPVKDCIINEYFIDANNVCYLRAEYCEKNCNHKCLQGRDYKKKQ